MKNTKKKPQFRIPSTKVIYFFLICFVVTLGGAFVLAPAHEAKPTAEIVSVGD